MKATKECGGLKIQRKFCNELLNELPDFLVAIDWSDNYEKRITFFENYEFLSKHFSKFSGDPKFVGFQWMVPDLENGEIPVLGGVNY